MREILFRAKTKQGEWAYGDLFKTHIFGEVRIMIATRPFMLCNDGEYDFEPIEVIPETVGQFTGLTDKNGKKVFEGDIVKWDGKEWGSPYNELVEFDYELLTMRKHDYKQWCEVIGNIHDNKELLDIGE